MNVSDLSVGSRNPYRYGVSSGVLAGSATSSIPLTLDSMTTFELHRIVGSSSADVKTQAINNYFTVLITQLNGQAWSSLPVFEQNFSTQSNPGWEFKIPVILPRQYQFSFSFADLGTGGTHYVELVGFMLR